MIGYVALGFVLGIATTCAAYWWLDTHADRVCDAIERAVLEVHEGGQR